MKLGNDTKFAIRALLEITPMIADMYRKGQMVVAFRNEMRAAGTDVPAGLVPEYDAIDKFVETTTAKVRSEAEKFGLPVPKEAAAPAAKIAVDDCDCTACIVRRRLEHSSASKTAPRASLDSLLDLIFGAGSAATRTGKES
jgi:hypothetical protein